MLGIPLHNIAKLLKSAAGGQWYPRAFDPILNKMIESHPPYVFIFMHDLS
jgi:hypothetical protein